MRFSSPASKRNNSNDDVFLNIATFNFKYFKIRVNFENFHLMKLCHFLKKYLKFIERDFKNVYRGHLISTC